MSKTAAKSKAPAKPLQVITADDGQDAEMGRQLTAQYERAIGGMKEVVIFGAMMMKLRELHPELAQRGGDRKSKSTVDNDPHNKPLTLQKWLETHAPAVKRPTALRFLAVTESIAEEYKTIVGATVAKQFSLPALVTTPADKLPKAAADKQLTLFEFVTGTSQKSWLDRFVPAKSGGGNNRSSPTVLKPKTAAQLEQEAEDEAADFMGKLDAWFLAGHHARVSKATRDTADAVLEEARKKIKAVKA